MQSVHGTGSKGSMVVTDVVSGTLYYNELDRLSSEWRASYALGFCAEVVRHLEKAWHGSSPKLLHEILTALEENTLAKPD